MLCACCEGKSSWPELLGVEGKEAANIIEKENPAVDAIIVTIGEVVIQDFRSDRVWVWVDKDGIVAKVPHIG
ncbi:Glu S.griseus protease inhibitor [Cocos nucifera]|nr:Glu S.griseus protease inhibitor [Cocos nucifera]